MRDQPTSHASPLDALLEEIVSKVAPRIVAETLAQLAAEQPANAREGPAAGGLFGMDLLTPKEAAKRLGMSERTLRSLTKDGKIAAVREGRKVLYDPRDLSAWMQNKKQRAPDDGAPPAYNRIG